MSIADAINEWSNTTTGYPINDETRWTMQVYKAIKDAIEHKRTTFKFRAGSKGAKSFIKQQFRQCSTCGHDDSWSILYVTLPQEDHDFDVLECYDVK